MINAFITKYTIPSRTHFTNLEKKYTEKLKSVLKETEWVALTTDIWTSVATEAYLGGSHVTFWGTIDKLSPSPL